MLRLTNKYSNRGKRAFTLVELIVVLVIIAILAAALVPALTGYIRRARRAKYIDAADAARTAAQAVMAELYGLGSGSRNGIANIVNGDGTVTLNGGGLGGDIRWDTASDAKNTDEQKAWGEKILNLLGYTRDNAPYIFVFGVGDPRVFGIDSDESYTVYYVAYVETSTSPAIFYVNGEWIYTYPRDNNKIMREVNGNRNTIVLNGVSIPLQLYVVSNRTNLSDNFWTGGDRSLRGHSQRSDGSYARGIRF